MQSERFDDRRQAESRLLRSSPSWRPQAQFSHVVGTGDQLEQLNASGSIAVDFIGLPKTGLHIAFEGNQSDTLSIWTTQTRHGFRTRPKLMADLVSIRFVNSGAIARNGPGGSDIVASFDQALFTSFTEMRHEQASAGFSAITATISRDAIVKACQALSGTDGVVLPQFAAIVEPNTIGLAAMRQTLASLHHQLPGAGNDRDMMTPLFQEMLVYQLISAWPTVGGDIATGGTDAADRPVRIAIDYIEANLRQRMEIAEIAAAAGVSVRALQIAFKRRLGCSPVHYLINRRLDRVHSTLQSFDHRTVRQAAQDWGFTHMSDFTRRYRMRFGHTPGTRIADGRDRRIVAL